MEPQGIDRNALNGIILISLILGVWMVFFAPTPPVEPDGQEEVAEAPGGESGGEATLSVPDGEAQAEDVLRAPTDTLFAGALEGTAHDIVVESDRYHATFSTQGGTLTSFKLLNYERAGSPEPVDLVSSEAGALALVFNPPQGRLVDTRTLFFQPVGLEEQNRIEVPDDAEQPVRLAFEAPVGDGVLRFIYGFTPDSYEIRFAVETEGTNVLAQSGGYEVVWDGAVPLAEADPVEEVAQSGAYVHWGGDTDLLRLSEAGEGEPFFATGAVDWVAVKTKFFAAVVIPEEPTEGAVLEGSQIGEASAPGSFAQDYTVRLEMPRPQAGEATAFRLYLGPMELRRLTGYGLGLYEMTEFGAFLGWMIRPIARYVVAPSFALLSTFLPNYGFVIILFAFLVKLVLYPLTKSSYTSMARMRDLQPKMEAIKEKHADDPQKQQEAMMRMYREAGVNPLGGCLPMLLQYPLLIAMWRFFQSTLVLRQESFLWAPDLSAPDPILHLPFAIPLYGDFVAGFTLLMGAAMFVQIKFVSPTGGAAMSGQQKMLMYAMPAFFFLFFNRFPSGLSLYYLAFNIFTILQQRLINKQLAGETGVAEVDVKKGKIKPAGAKGNGRAATNGQAGRTKKTKR